MFIRDHAKERYVERVVGVNEKKDIKKYIAEHNFEICFKIMEMVNEAELLHDSFAVSKGATTYCYYINGDYLIVLTFNKKEVITIYNLVLDLKENKNHRLIKEHVKTIRKNINLIKRKEEIKNRQDNETMSIEYAIDLTRESLRKLESSREHSIETCVKMTKEIKEIRYENRELMTKLMFGFREFKEKEHITT
ncbi:hypothetical protein [Bacillus weihaiensis]|uniref:hypothetical protein n=1 Tax=Bacillus weihaiensis TaxID=1547283 RepID=UPI002357E1A6|nr:hypothetical protein [Bacillus weihaiensis]